MTGKKPAEVTTPKYPPNGLFVRWIITLTSGLLLLGVGGSIVVAFDTNAKLAAIDVHIANIYERLGNLEHVKHNSP